MPENSALTVHRERLRERAVTFAAAQRHLEEERAAIKVLVLDAIDAGMAELEVSKLSGVTRDSVRRWVGK